MDAKTIAKIIDVLDNIAKKTELTEEEEKYLNIAIGIIAMLVHKSDQLRREVHGNSCTCNYSRRET